MPTMIFNNFLAQRQSEPLSCQMMHLPKKFKNLIDIYRVKTDALVEDLDSYIVMVLVFVLNRSENILLN